MIKLTTAVTPNGWACTVAVACDGCDAALAYGTARRDGQRNPTERERDASVSEARSKAVWRAGLKSVSVGTPADDNAARCSDCVRAGRFGATRVVPPAKPVSEPPRPETDTREPLSWGVDDDADGVPFIIARPTPDGWMVTLTVTTSGLPFAKCEFVAGEIEAHALGNRWWNAHEACARAIREAARLYPRAAAKYRAAVTVHA